MDIKELESGVNPWEHWYYQSKKYPLLSMVSRLLQQKDQLNIIDIGAGSGFFSEVILKTFPESIHHVFLVDTAYTMNEMSSVSNGKISKLHDLPNPMESSLYIMMDVLEHLADDLEMLMKVKQQCGPESSFFITVPAFKSIWSDHDIFLEHYRRYTRQSLQKVLSLANFKTEKCYYLYGSLFPIVFIKRRLNSILKSKHQEPTSDMKPVPKWLNTLLLKYCCLEMIFTKYNIFFGLTCVAEGKC